MSGDHRDLHVLTHSYPTRLSSDLVQGRDPDSLHGLDLLIERQPNLALPGKVVNLVRPDLVQRLQDTAEVCDGNRYQPDLVMDAERLQVTERRGLRIPGRTVDLITMAKQQLRQIGTILATDPTDQCRSEEHTSELQSLMRTSYAV